MTRHTALLDPIASRIYRELVAMRAVVDALAPLSTAGRRRVVAFWADKLGIKVRD